MAHLSVDECSFSYRDCFHLNYNLHPMVLFFGDIQPTTHAGELNAHANGQIWHCSSCPVASHWEEFGKCFYGSQRRTVCSSSRWPISITLIWLSFTSLQASMVPVTLEVCAQQQTRSQTNTWSLDGRRRWCHLQHSNTPTPVIALLIPTPIHVRIVFATSKRRKNSLSVNTPGC